MASLFELNEQMLALDKILSENTDPETNEILESAKEQLGKDIEDKMENILGYMAECKARVEYLKGEENRIADKRKGIEKRIDWLKGMVFGQMKLNNRQKAEYGSWNVSIAKCPDSIVLTDEAEQWLPDSLCRISRLPDKKAIKDAMAGSTELKISVDGREIVVANLETGKETVRIR